MKSNRYSCTRNDVEPSVLSTNSNTQYSLETELFSAYAIDVHTMILQQFKSI